MIHARTDLSVKDIKTLEIDGFKGIDYSSGALKASKQRAIAAKNFMVVDGNMQTRPGWAALNSTIKATGSEYYYQYYENTTDKFIVRLNVAQSATSISILANKIALDGTVTTISSSVLVHDLVEGAAQNIVFCQSGETLFVFGYGMAMAMVLDGTTYRLHELMDDEYLTHSSYVLHPYYPTTTISIDPTETASPRVSAVLDNPNMLTGWRKNTGRSDSTLAVTQTFVLDAPVAMLEYGSEMSFNANITGWTAHASSAVTRDTTNGYMVNTVDADSTDAFGYCEKNISFTASEIHFVKVRFRVTNALATNIYVKTDVATLITQAAPVANTWYELYVNYTGATDTKLRIEHEYASAANAQNAVMEVDFINYFNLTDMFGSGSEPAAAYFDTWIDTNTGSPYVYCTMYAMGLAGSDTGNMYEIFFSSSDDGKIYARKYRRYDATAWTDISPAVDSGTVVRNTSPFTTDGVATIEFDDFTYFAWTAADDNMTFTFEINDWAANKAAVLNCTIGTTFGVNGNTTQLFLTGNATYPNRDFWSYPLDFTYFPDNNYADIGTDGSAITGYLRLSDGTLAIFKNYINGEPGIFFRSGTLVTDETTLEAETVYDIKGGMLDYQCVAPNASAVLAGDPLFVTDKGVYAIVSSTDNITTNKRFVRERSLYLGDMTWTSAACGIAYDNRYWLADGAGNVYVADARFKRYEDRDMDDTFTYEWYHLDHITAYQFIVADGDLYFLEDTGTVVNLCVFNDEFRDTLLTQTVAGHMTIAEGTADITKIAAGTLAYSFDAIDAAIADDYEAAYQFKFIEAGMYAYIFKASDITITAATGTVVVTEGLAGGTWENIYKLTDTVSARTPLVIRWKTGSGRTNVVTVYVLDVDVATLTFHVAVSQTSLTAYDLTSLTGYADIDGFILPITDVWLYGSHTGTTLQLTEYAESDPLLITYINPDNPVATPTAYLRAFYHYEANWYMPVLDMGTNVYTKLLESITAVVDPGNCGPFSIGYETRAKDISAIVQGTEYLDFGDISFENLNFATSFITSYTKRVKAKFNFIIFRFVATSGLKTVLNGLTVRYKINNLNKGVR